MPENFVVSTKFIAKDQMAVFWNQQNQQADKFGKMASRNFNRASRSASRFGDVLGGIVSAQLLSRAFFQAKEQIAGFVAEASRVEDATVFFRTLTGSMEKAVGLVDDLRALGAVTPFEFKDFVQVSSALLAMKATTLDTLITDLTMLGDTAGGSADKLDRIAFAYAETAANSKASFQEIRQFTNAGIPMLATLSEMWGANGAEARKMVRAGKATASEVRKAFQIMTREGGLFFKGMERSSKTFTGRMSTLRDEINIAKATIGEQFLPVLKEYITDTINAAKAVGVWAENNQDLIKEEVNKWLATSKDILKELWPVAKIVLGIISDLLPVVRFLAPILPVMAAGWAANKIALAGMGLITIGQNLLVMTGIVKGATAAQLGWNIAMIANPIGLVILGITLLVAAIVLVVKNWDFLKEQIVNGAIFIMTKIKEFFFGFLRFIIDIPRKIAIAFFGFMSKVGEILGLETIEKEFRALIDVMDELDRKLGGAAGQRPWWMERDVKEAMKALLQGQRLNVTPPTIELAPSEYTIEDVPAATRAIKLDVNRLDIEKAFPQMPATAINRFAGLAGPNVNIPAPAAVPAMAGGGGNRAFVAPQRIDRNSVVEHRVRLDIAGAPEGTKLIIGKSKASAPPISVKMLGGS